ncbi:MAG TPA: 50S ribosomal protein L25 [Patescibacteria group bacterium]|nr:50S ribosomal protein L25 [Patescibacteria group bacterium]
MTAEYVLNAKKREVTGEKIDSVRKEGLIPAVVYGKGKENVNLVVNAIEFNKVFTKTGENTLIKLNIEGEGVAKNVLAHDVAYNPVSDAPIHIDFYEVKMDEEVETEVPLVFIGESPAVKDFEGTLITNKSEVTVKCLPANIPHEIEVDISKLSTFEDSITVADLKIPTGVELITELEETVALVEAPRSEEELKELDTEVVENVEAVEATEEKKEEEGVEEAVASEGGEKKEEKAE